MKTRSLFITLTTALAIAVALIVTGCSQRRDREFKDLPGLLSALEAFSRDLTNKGQPLPPSVSLDELVSRGYISSNSVHAFEGMETRIWAKASPDVPNSVLMSARSPDGSVSAVLADGSVHQFSAQVFAEHLRNTGQQDSTAKRSQPIGSETNSAPSAPGSSRRPVR
jgi:hypothetical protein